MYGSSLAPLVGVTYAAVSVWVDHEIPTTGSSLRCPQCKIPVYFRGVTPGISLKRGPSPKTLISICSPLDFAWTLDP